MNEDNNNYRLTPVTASCFGLALAAEYERRDFPSYDAGRLQIITRQVGAMTSTQLSLRDLEVLAISAFDPESDVPLHNLASATPEQLRRSLRGEALKLTYANGAVIFHRAESSLISLRERTFRVSRNDLVDAPETPFFGTYAKGSSVPYLTVMRLCGKELEKRL